MNATLSFDDLPVLLKIAPLEVVQLVARQKNLDTPDVEPDVDGVYRITAGNVTVRGANLTEACEKFVRRALDV